MQTGEQMKLALITDTHFGCRNDHKGFLDYFEDYYKNQFFAELKNRNIKKILHLGDFFDKRTYIDFYTLSRTREIFLDRLVENNITMDILVGNHDSYYKNTTDINSLKELFRGYESHINVVNDFIVRNFDGLNIALMSWIVDDTKEKAIEFIKSKPAPYIAGHFEILGQEMQTNLKSDFGLTTDLFNGYEKVMSGHFHKKSEFYLGTPYQLSWDDYGDKRGFHILDTQTKQLEFIENEKVLFHKIYYSTNSDIKIEDYKGCYVKLIVTDKDDPKKLVATVAELGKVAFNVAVIEKETNAIDVSSNSDILLTKTTIEIINDYLNKLYTNPTDNKIMRSLFKVLYTEAEELQ